ncbi:MAG TPA: hypothetical protein VIG07_07390 [Methylomirabilota bacterium]
MKRTTLAVLMIALALVALAAPMAFAQAPAPKVSITGFIDNLGTYSQNGANYNGGTFNRGDDLFYGRTRGRFDIVGEVGKAKAVFGFELDHVWGQTGSNDSTINNAGAAGTTAVTTGLGTDGGFDLNTDSRGIVEVKWLYVEFPMPLIPVPTTVRLGAQPFGAAATYKLAAYATGDFPGVNVVSQITPNVKLLGTYVQVEEALTGTDTAPFPVTTSPSGVSATQVRGDDFAYIISAEITPFKGLDIKPMFSMFYAQGTTSSSARAGRGGIGTGTPVFATADVGTNCGAQTGGPGTNCFRGGINEYRYTTGVDARLRMGPFSLDPTVLYQFGNRAVIVPSNSAACLAAGTCFSFTGATPGQKKYADISAWLIDVRGGFQLGPLLLEGLVAWSTGNSARNSSLDTVRYFQPLTTDTSYQADWGSQLTALGVDYLNAWNEAAGRIAYPGNQIGWDKYGRLQVGAKATYAITPDLSLMGGANVHWTAEKVDRNGVAGTGSGINPVFNGSTPRDRSRYVGTELFGVITWRFAPGISWDNAGGYMFMGDALDAVTDPTAGGQNVNNPWILTSRVRFSF